MASTIQRETFTVLVARLELPLTELWICGKVNSKTIASLGLEDGFKYTRTEAIDHHVDGGKTAGVMAMSRS